MTSACLSALQSPPARPLTCPLTLPACPLLGAHGCLVGWHRFSCVPRGGPAPAFPVRRRPAGTERGPDAHTPTAAVHASRSAWASRGLPSLPGRKYSPGSSPLAGHPYLGRRGLPVARSSLSPGLAVRGENSPSTVTAATLHGPAALSGAVSCRYHASESAWFLFCNSFFS